MVQTIGYRDRSKNFLAKAREELAEGDLEQASEKAWGAAALIVKALGTQRGEVHEKHSHLFNIVHALARQYHDHHLRHLFYVASALHSNFYENTFDPQAVSDGIEDVETFVEKVDQLL